MAFNMRMDAMSIALFTPFRLACPCVCSIVNRSKTANGDYPR